MLWYKMWRESSVRFAFGAIALSWMCAAVVALQHQVRAHADAPLTYAHYIWSAVYKANVLDLFILMVIVLGLGGVMQERAQGTAGFTLSLPVARWRLVAARAGMGMVQVSMFALIPAMLIPVLSPFAGETFPFAQALQWSALWTGCGLPVFALAFFFSTLLPGSYSPAIASVAGLLSYSALAQLPPLKRHGSLDLLETMHGAQLLDPHSGASLPWLSLSLYALMALLLVWGSAVIVTRRDF